MPLNRHDVYRAIRNELSKNRTIYRLLASRRGAEPLDRSTDLLIEGYPRSANSFLEAYTKVLSNEKLRLAHHSHSRSVVMRALDMGKPILLLVRNPVDAAVSYLEESNKLSSPWVLFREYSIFYQGLERHRERILFCSFNTATKHPERIFPALNSKFGTSFSLRTPDNEDNDKISNLMLLMGQTRADTVPAYLALRTEDERIERQKRRAAFRTRLEDPMHAAVRSRAQSQYKTLAELSI